MLFRIALLFTIYVNKTLKKDFLRGFNRVKITKLLPVLVNDINRQIIPQKDILNHYHKR